MLAMYSRTIHLLLLQKKKKQNSNTRLIMDKIDQVISEILKAIYWPDFTKGQQEKIKNLFLSGLDNMSIANELCDYLGIQRRGNRQNIMTVLNKNR